MRPGAACAERMPHLSGSHYCPAVNAGTVRLLWQHMETHMFVRAVWRLRRLIDVKQTLREMEVPTTRDAFGISGTEFQKMTRGLFDR